MKIRKALAIILSGLMIGSLFTGCGGEEKDSSGGQEGSYDFGGKTVTVACWVDMTPKLGNSDGDDARYYAYEYAKEKYNCDIEFISMPENDYFQTFIAKSLSGQKFADIVTAHCWNYVSWIEQGLLLPVTEYMEDADEHWNTIAPNYKNEIWSINAYAKTKWPEYFLLYNTDILAELNLESPQELARQGKWTWEKFEDYCKRAVADTNNDGTVDRYGMPAFWLPEILRMSADFTTVTYQDGKYYNAWTHPNTKAQGLSLLQFMQDLKVKDNAILGNTIGGTGASEEAKEAFRTGKVLFVMGGYSGASDFKKEGMTNFKPVTLPYGPGVTSLKNYIQSFSFSAIPKYKDYETDALVAFWKDCQTTWDESRGDAYDASTAEDAIQAAWADCYLTLEDTQFMYDMGKNMEYVCTMESTIDIDGQDIWKLYQPVLRNTSTPAAVIEATDGIFQSAIDSTLNNSADAK